MFRVKEFVEVDDYVLLLESDTCLRIYKQHFGTVSLVWRTREGGLEASHPSEYIPTVVIDELVGLMNRA